MKGEWKMEVEWKSNIGKIKAIHWGNSITLEDINNQLEKCDYLQLCYPRNCDERIYDEYGEILTYFEYGGEWGGKAYSSIINLEQSNEDIFCGITKNRRYEIRRAFDRDNLHIEFNANISDEELMQYIAFYHQFALTKKGVSIDVNRVKAMVKENKFLIAKVLNKNNTVLVMHGYMTDEKEGIAALFSSSSLFRIDKSNANLIGRANAFLHYSSMLHFKKNGFKVYDMGGVYQGKENLEFTNVAKFKQSFGGSIEEFSSGFILPASEIRNIHRTLKQNRDLFFKYTVIVWGAGAFGKYIIKQLKQKMGVAVDKIIDNKLSDYNSEYYTENILNMYEPTNTVVIVTMNEMICQEIKKQENCKAYQNAGMLICVREKEKHVERI